MKGRRNKRNSFSPKKKRFWGIILFLDILFVTGHASLSLELPEWTRNRAFLDVFSEKTAHYLSPSYVPDTGTGSAEPQQTEQSSKPNKKIKKNGGDGLEIPAYLTDRPEEIVRHTAYTVSYNRKLKIPNWVAWILTPERISGNATRSDDFQPDPDIRKGHTAEDSDYRHSGYSRGHMCPAADNKFSEKAMEESFYFSNICPQLQSLNGGDWNELEEKCRKWSKRYQRIYIVCGPILTSKHPKTIGANQITVPDAFFKVIMRHSDQETKAIGFIYPHKKQNRPLWDYAVTVDHVEEITGINFFSKLPEREEQKAESVCTPEDWN